MEGDSDLPDGAAAAARDASHGAADGAAGGPVADGPRLASVCYHCGYVALSVRAWAGSHRCARRPCRGPTFLARGTTPGAIAAAVLAEVGGSGASEFDQMALVENLAVAWARFAARRRVQEAIRARLPNAHPLKVVALARHESAGAPSARQRLVVLYAARPRPGPSAREEERAQAREARKAERAARHVARCAAAAARKARQKAQAAEEVRARRAARRARLDPACHGPASPAAPVPGVRRRPRQE